MRRCPAGVAAGTVPIAVIPTINGPAGFACAPVPTPGGTVVCNGTTPGIGLQGATVNVVFGPGLTAAGILSGQGPPPLLPPTINPIFNVTVPQAISFVPISGQLGVPCAVVPGQICTVSGQFGGAALLTGNAQWTLTVPLFFGNVAPGTVPIAVVPRWPDSKRFPASRCPSR